MDPKGKNATGPTYRCPCCGKEHPITPAMMEAAICGLSGFSADEIEEEAATTLIREILAG